MFLFVGAFAVGEGLPPLNVESAPFFVAWFGLLAIWPWRLLGGLSVVVGMAAFLLVTATIPNLWFSLWMVPGLLSLAGWWIEHRGGRIGAGGRSLAAS